MSTRTKDELHAELIEFLGHKYPIGTYEAYAAWLASHDQGAMYLRQAIEQFAYALLKLPDGHDQLEAGFEYLDSLLRKARQKVVAERELLRAEISALLSREQCVKCGDRLRGHEDENGTH